MPSLLTATTQNDSIKQLLDSLRNFGDGSMDNVGVLAFFVLLGMSLASAYFVSYLYVTFYSSRATGSQIHRSFPLLSLSITAIFICIQFSLPLSLGLLGALSIVRFRTPIKEPEEIGFLMLVIASSLCCATFNLLFLAILLAVAVIGLLARQMMGAAGSTSNDGLLTIALPLESYREKGADLIKMLGERIPRGHLDGVIENGDEATVSYRFRRLAPALLGQVQSDVSSAAEASRTSVYYLNSSGA